MRDTDSGMTSKLRKPQSHDVADPDHNLATQPWKIGCHGVHWSGQPEARFSNGRELDLGIYFCTRWVFFVLFRLCCIDFLRFPF